MKIKQSIWQQQQDKQWSDILVRINIFYGTSLIKKIKWYCTEEQDCEYIQENNNKKRWMNTNRWLSLKENDKLMKEKGYKVQKVSVVTTLETFEFSNDPRSKGNQETKVKEKKRSVNIYQQLLNSPTTLKGKIWK